MAMGITELLRKQLKFSLMVGKLIVWAYENGYQITLGDAFRAHPDFVKSLHGLRLAIDLNLFIRGEYMENTEAYLPLGEYWESLGGSWGGRFSKPDGNHFSLEHEGVR